MKKQKRKGFTLVELVIALSVLVIGLVGIIVVIPLGQRSAKDASVVTRAAMAAAGKIEEIQAYGFDHVAAEPPPFALSGTDGNIQWTVTISDVLVSDFSELVTIPVQHLKKIVVTVTYSINQQQRSDTFSSFIAQF